MVFVLVRWDRNLHVPIDPLPWPEGTRERMSINSFGLGGSNVHVSGSNLCLKYANHSTIADAFMFYRSFSTPQTPWESLHGAAAKP